MSCWHQPSYEIAPQNPTLNSALAYASGRHLPILVLPSCCLFADIFSLQVLLSGEMLLEQPNCSSRALRSNHTLLDYPLGFRATSLKCPLNKCRPAASTGQLPCTAWASHGVPGVQPLTEEEDSSFLLIHFLSAEQNQQHTSSRLIVGTPELIRLRFAFP